MTMSNLEGPRDGHPIQGRSWSLQQLNLEHNNEDFNPDDNNDFNPDGSDAFYDGEGDNRDQKVSSRYLSSGDSAQGSQGDEKQTQHHLSSRSKLTMTN